LGLAAGFGKELFGAEMVLDRDLGKQHSSLALSRYEQSMSADLDMVGANGNWRGEQRYFDLQITELVRAHGWEAWILQRGARGATYDAISKRFGLHNANAAAQTLAGVKSNEYSALLRENSVGGDLRQYLPA
jgi:hypothetical protein